MLHSINLSSAELYGEKQHESFSCFGDDCYLSLGIRAVSRSKKNAILSKTIYEAVLSSGGISIASNISIATFGLQQHPVSVE